MGTVMAPDGLVIAPEAPMVMLVEPAKLTGGVAVFVNVARIR
jgi:hypothetical protein